MVGEESTHIYNWRRTCLDASCYFCFACTRKPWTKTATLFAVGIKADVQLALIPQRVIVYHPQTLVCTYTGTYTVIGLTWLKNLYSVAVHKIENNQCIDFKKPDASLYSYNCSAQTNTFSLTILNVTRLNARENWACAVFIDDMTVQSEPVSIQIISKY
jgi:hypothetical protein